MVDTAKFIYIAGGESLYERSSDFPDRLAITYGIQKYDYPNTNLLCK